MFDNLYFVGQTEYSAWAVTTSAGIILVDTIYDYSVEDEVVGGLRKLGLDPATIKYAIVSHGHGDHSGGAKYLQDHFGTRIILSADDWDLLDRSNGTKPKRDMVATDGQKLTLGDTTRHDVHHARAHLRNDLDADSGEGSRRAAPGGGVGRHRVQLADESQRLHHGRPARLVLVQDATDTSARRFRDIADRAGADVIIANHTNFDGSKTKLPAVLARKAGDPNPYVIGKNAVQRYMTVADECAQAGLLMRETAAVAGRSPSAQPHLRRRRAVDSPSTTCRRRWSRKTRPARSARTATSSTTTASSSSRTSASSSAARRRWSSTPAWGRRTARSSSKKLPRSARTREIYLVTTHFHAEHVAGISAFPAGTKYVISRVQQQDLDELGADLTKRFAGGSPVMADLLKDAPVRRADVLFDREYKIDLGGVNVRLLALGSTHTRGDTMVFVEQDKVLYAGDVVMPRVPVAFSQTSSAKVWEDVFAQLTPLGATVIVPAHGPTGTGAMLAEQRAAFAGLRTRVRELKAQGQPVDDAVKTLTAEFQQQHPDWTATNRVGAIVRGMYGE